MTCRLTSSAERHHLRRGGVTCQKLARPAGRHQGEGQWYSYASGREKRSVVSTGDLGLDVLGLDVWIINEDIYIYEQ